MERFDILREKAEAVYDAIWDVEPVQSKAFDIIEAALRAEQNEPRARLVAELRKSLDIAESTIRTLTAKLNCLCGSDINHARWDGSFPVTQYDKVLDRASARAAEMEAAIRVLSPIVTPDRSKP